MKREPVRLFEIPDTLPQEDEFFETLASGKGLRIERIISHGHKTPEGRWYDQELDEWVVLLGGEATLEWEDGTQSKLEAGSAVFIAAHQRHRVVATSSDSPCVWLAVHGRMKPSEEAATT
ncbi:cupin domain-containing protein [Bradymonadaceae bacterium TMQ3]|uniref:Cupin domain-containing protein n=1 Tax=Lujinxingia sediminis TaxID=2480984 RepID=A0ABY0CN40_9DELT|nr:cupin domain-containing protein [Lujinxingia sediminis]RDV36500.1 cupin domain-containing protein [Bradymonadaceae bacterium TMQ3]RVU41385.1 cupin domain-containing protein [Lujinxingia sediminis]TXC74553.1 cupin domain-containing protein [Bradymonadales bacterium TMQ1]